MPFVWLHTLAGEDVALNSNVITLVCRTKKGTRIFFEDGTFHDVQEEFVQVLSCLNTTISNFKK